MSEKLHVLVWGATSSVGCLVAEYVTRHYGVGGDLSWGLGGRNRAKLEGIRARLTAIDLRAQRLPIFIADANDAASLDAIVPRVKVIATTVGPYARYGHELVAACTRHGVDYCDLTGEVLFIRDMIDRHHAEAQRTGARIVHCCGFDSIPSDLGVLMVQRYMTEHYRGRCVEVKYFVTGMRGGFGGGTAASALFQFEQAKDPRALRILLNPYALDPGWSDHNPEARDSLKARWDAELGAWTGPFVMAPVNTRVVRRSNGLSGYSYGKDFRYSEAIGFSAGPKGWLAANSLSVGLKAVMGGLQLATVRGMAARLVPPPGKGPSQATRERGFFKIRLIGIGDGKKIYGTVAGTSDPGHGETSKMLAESALSLALDPDRKLSGGGVLTPAAAMGTQLIERLRKAGMTFEVTDTP